MSQASRAPQPGTAGRSWVRGKDRRTAFPHFLATLTRSLRHRDSEMLRQVFEQGIRHLVPVKAVQLRDASVPAAEAAPAVGDTFSLPVPTSDPTRAVSLDGQIQANRRLSDWDRQTLDNAVHIGALIAEIDRFTRRAQMCANGKRDGAAPLVGSSEVMCALRERIEKVAATDFCVLIEGESGTGKELVARHVHDLSRRAAGPFVAINCAALVETLFEAELFGIEDRTATGVRGRRGKFEHADGGTLFLDEVSDLSLSAQAKLLRAIQDLAIEPVGACGTRRVDTRIVVATNRSLGELVDRRLFRHDLFYRLSGVEIRVPPLRSRRDDILELATYFLARHRGVRRLEFTREAADALVLHDWPGNVRELERVLEGVVALAQGERIDLDDLPPAIRGDYADSLMPSLMRGDSLRAWGSRYVRLVLERCDQNKRQACRQLGISYHTLRAYLQYRPANAREPVRPMAQWPTTGTESESAACRVAETTEDELSSGGTAARRSGNTTAVAVEPIANAIVVSSNRLPAGIAQ